MKESGQCGKETVWGLVGLGLRARVLDARQVLWPVEHVVADACCYQTIHNRSAGGKMYPLPNLYGTLR